MGKVKKLVKYFVIADDDDQIKHQHKSFLQELDKHGNVIREVDYKADGGVDNAADYTYDENNRLIKEVHYYEDGVSEIIRYNLDENGRRTEVETTYADDSKSVKKIVRDNNTITVTTFDEDGDTEEEEQIKYDEQGRIVEEVKTDEDGKTVTHSEYTYNNKGKLLYKTEYEGDNGSFIKTTLDYDNRDNLVSETQVTDQGNLVQSVNYQYNDKGERTTWQNNYHVHHVEYDEHGRPVTEETKNRMNNLIENFTEYKYNQQGLVAEERTFNLGGQYQIEAAVFGGSSSDFVITKYEYEFYDEQ